MIDINIYSHKSEIKIQIDHSFKIQSTLKFIRKGLSIIEQNKECIYSPPPNGIGNDFKPNCYGEGNKCQLYKGCPRKRGKDISFLDVFHLYFKIFLIDLQVLILQASRWRPF